MSTSAATLSSATHQIWRTPIPYLYGGLGAVLVLISIALFMLACSYQEHHATGGRLSDADGQECPVKSVVMVPLDAEPRVAVIMAGDDVPSHIAMPKPKMAAPAQNCCCDAV